MANAMTTKRTLLRDYLEGVLQGHVASYIVVDRLRMATFRQTSRTERIEIMGEDYAYAEVLYRPSVTPEGQRSAASTSRNRHHNYQVFVWYKLTDDDVYASSSQATWDDIIEADDGVLASLEGKKYLTDAGGNQYVLSKPQNINAPEVIMDTDPLELAHHLNFDINVRGS